MALVSTSVALLPSFLLLLVRHLFLVLLKNILIKFLLLLVEWHLFLASCYY